MPELRDECGDRMKCLDFSYRERDSGALLNHRKGNFPAKPLACAINRHGLRVKLYHVALRPGLES